MIGLVKVVIPHKERGVKMRLSVGDIEEKPIIITVTLADSAEWGVAVKANGYPILYIRPRGDVYMSGECGASLKELGFETNVKEEVVVR
jgi:hypothetical protein